MSPKLQMLMFSPNGGLVAAVEPPAVSGVGSLGGFQFMLQDQGGNTLSDLDRVAHQITNAGAANKDLTDLFTTFSANDPQELVTIDREKAKAMGVSITQIATTLNVFMGSEYINDFDYNNRTYRVYVQADQQFRMNASQLHSYYVRSDSGQMVPLDNLVTVAVERRRSGDYALQPVPRGGDRRLSRSRRTAPARHSKAWRSWPPTTRCTA